MYGNGQEPQFIHSRDSNAIRSMMTSPFQLLTINTTLLRVDLGFLVEMKPLYIQDMHSEDISSNMLDSEQ